MRAPPPGLIHRSLVHPNQSMTLSLKLFAKKGHVFSTVVSVEMHEGMMNFVRSAMSDADVLLVMIEVREREFKDKNILEKLQKIDTPIILLINKIDEIDQSLLEEKVNYWKDQLPKSKVFPISALHNFNVDQVLMEIKASLPESPPFYDKDALTDKPEKFFVSEIIREKILINYKKEIPYSCEVEVEEFKEETNIIRIRAVIMVIRESQKGIIIGHQGKSLKKVGTDARIDMEK